MLKIFFLKMEDPIYTLIIKPNYRYYEECNFSTSPDGAPRASPWHDIPTTKGRG